MTQAEFIAKHGPCQPAPELDAYFRTRCVRPALTDGKWALGRPGAAPILDGYFTTWGYFTAGQQPELLDLPWQALNAALAQARTWAAQLQTAGCRGSLDSEGDAPYFPFVQSRPRTGRTWNTKSIVGPLAGPLRKALANREMLLQYTSEVQFLNVDDQRCLFMSDPEEEDDDEPDLPVGYGELYRVSQEMRSHLKLICEAQLFPSFGEFPVLYIGEDAADQLVGLITTCVWT